MSTTTLSRLSGAALLLGGLGGAVAVAIHPQTLADALNPPLHLGLFVVVVLVLFGLPVLVTRQSERVTRLGVFGAAMLALCMLMNDLMHSVLMFTIVPVLASDAGTRSLLEPGSWVDESMGHGLFGMFLTVSVPLAVVGMLAFSAATIRAGALPRWPAVMHIASACLLPVSMLVPGTGEIAVALLYLGFGAYGWVLLSYRSPVAVAASRIGASAELQLARR